MRAHGLLFAGWVALGCRPPDATPAPPDPPARSLLDEPIGWLEALGLSFSGPPIPVAHVSPFEAAAELGRRSDATWSDARVLHVYGLMWLTLGDEALGVDVEVLREGLRSGATRPALAYYGRDRIAVIDKEATSLVPQPALMAHELVHTYQDQTLPIGVFEALLATDTVDDLSVLQLTFEGHAEFVGLAAYLSGQGVPLQSLSAEVFDPGPARIQNPTASLLYERGALAMLSAFERGGLAAVDALLRDPPLSSEQLLHPCKLGTDAPTNIAIPTLPGAKAGPSTTVGELALRNLLAARILDEALLSEATTGWDGDRLTWYETPQGTMLVWRSIWDRPADVEQLLVALDGFGTRPASSAVVVDGRQLDIVAMLPPGTGAQARRFAQALPRPRPPASDGATSTAEAERTTEARRQRRAVVVDQRVTVEHSGVRIPIPPGWTVQRLRGIPFLRAPMREGFGDNVLVYTAPTVLETSLPQVAATLRVQLCEGLEHACLREETTVVAGREAWLLESVGREADGTLELHQLRVVFFTPTHRVIVVFSASPEHWSDVGPVFADQLARIDRAR